jgi:DNA processing protein
LTLAPFLWVRGQVQALRLSPRVTIVGSREASALGMKRARALGRTLGERGALVISGGALGIDAAAHQGALDADGHSCAVLGTGVDVSYPMRHAPMFAELTRRGCLLSMLELSEPPRRGQFPQRNRLMAALADLVVVVEAQLHSGTVYTAQSAGKLGRRVVCFPDSPGTRAMIAAGATSVSSIAEVLALLGQDEPATASSSASATADEPPASETASLLPFTLTPASEKLRCALSGKPQDLGELCARTGLSAADCAAAVIELELHGHCSRLPGGRYIGHAPLC